MYHFVSALRKIHAGQTKCAQGHCERPSEAHGGVKGRQIGNTPIDKIKTSDAREWAVRMGEKYAFNTVNNFKRSLIKAFHIAVEDDYVRKKPFQFNLVEVLEDDRKPREALTEAQEQVLLSFAESDKTYNRLYDSLLILLNTGLRISELCGLTISDIDFESGLISVERQLLADKETGYYIDKPKTSSGVF